MPEPKETTDAQKAALGTYHVDARLRAKNTEAERSEEPVTAPGDEEATEADE